jgi:hypothetical protein
MKYLVYLSTATKFMPDENLVELLVASRERNKIHDITGVLLYSGGTFIQVLEGAPGDVDLIFKSIERDHRHGNIIKLFDEPLAKRNFPEWSMGFTVASSELIENISGYLKTTDEITENKNGHFAISILKSYIQTNNLSLNG